MINVLLLAAILLVFTHFDLLLRLGRVFNREAPVAYSELILQRALRHIFALLRGYRGFKLEFDDRVGDAMPERFILVANHQSLIDIPVLAVVLPDKKLRFVAKKELGGGVPLVSISLRLQGHALIKRHGDPVQAMRTLTRYARRCRRLGYCPVIFPEGTRSRTGKLGHFHVGGLRRVLAEEAIPLVVVAIDGGWQVYGLRPILRRLKGVTYRVRVAAVLPAPQGKQEVIAAVAESRRIIAEALAEMRSS